MDPQAPANIDASRERLRRFVESRSEADLARTVEGQGTVAALLAHTAFWDRRAACLLRRCQDGICAPSPVDLDAINESALPQWSLIPPRAAAHEALEAACDIDELVAGAEEALLAALRELDIRYDRSGQRSAHLDQIERSLGRY